MTATLPSFNATPSLVGSFPHTAADELVADVLRRFRGLPAWPQLPARDWRESMYVQYSEGLPGAVIDNESQRIYFDQGPDFQSALEEFYLAVVNEQVDRFAISREYALGLHLFLEKLQQGDPDGRRWVKGQVTGPFSFAMTVTDAAKRSLAYTPDLREVATQGMAMKARWMARRLREVSPGVVVVLDEPYLSSFGSAFVNVPREDVIAALDGAIAAIHAEGALAGIHCCGNTDWALVFSTEIDIVNFDAYSYFQGVPLYPDHLRAFLDRGGILSWGIVPTSAADDGLEAATLLGLLDDRVGQLVAKGMDRARLYRQAILTPSCGMGSHTIAAANRAMDLVVRLAELVQERERLQC
jgi:methionine synthase II (cobalamin-independent)